ncbi:uncharacterized protein BDV17DRAFT_244143 [Aspergillus undulatus]|uniref:uncharacterized protein n=1 Tax=Aspergillus undulatus TaxID=1810928 RepID=UPI003CCE199B
MSLPVTLSPSFNFQFLNLSQTSISKTNLGGKPGSCVHHRACCCLLLLQLVLPCSRAASSIFPRIASTLVSRSSSLRIAFPVDLRD